MTTQESQQLPHGLYFLLWKSGGASMAAVGILHDGTRWYAPVNWTNESHEKVTSCNWAYVESAYLVVSQQAFKEYLNKQ